MADRSFLDGPSFDDGHRELAREFGQRAAGRLPSCAEAVYAADHVAGAQSGTALQRATP